MAVLESYFRQEDGPSAVDTFRESAVGAQNDLDKGVLVARGRMMRLKQFGVT